VQTEHVLQLSRCRYLDAAINGNISKNVRHDCEPNCELYVWMVDGQPRVGLFARRKIEPEQEITVSYTLRYACQLIRR
jgi:SET domain-containing protein